MLKQIFCNHDYEISEKIQSPSALQVMKESGVGLDGMMPFWTVQQMSQKKLVIIQKCKHCQKSKITTVTT